MPGKLYAWRIISHAPPSRIRTKVLQSRFFARLDLGALDSLTQDIELVLAYHDRIDSEMFESAVEHGLEAFPHLTGCLKNHDGWYIEPKAEGVRLEMSERNEPLSAEELGQLALDDHRSQFMPVADSAVAERDLFSVRLTQAGKDMSLLGLRVSHAAVDGTGLALFLHHCTAAMGTFGSLPVVHDRNSGRGVIAEGLFKMPSGYHFIESGAEIPDPLAQKPSTIFSMEISALSEQFSGKSFIETRLRLSAWLCAELAAMQPSFSEVAVWCDPRRLNGIPQSFTGNSGCYLHLQLKNKPVSDLAEKMRSLATRKGFLRIAETHQQIQRAEMTGQPVAGRFRQTASCSLTSFPTRQKARTSGRARRCLA